MTLAEFLLARIAEDEAAARSAIGLNWHSQEAAKLYTEPHNKPGWHLLAEGRDLPTFRHIARWDPTRVLVECKVKRQVVSVYQVLAVGRHDVGSIRWHEVIAYETVLRQLASVYADHPDYRQEWAP